MAAFSNPPIGPIKPIDRPLIERPDRISSAPTTKYSVPSFRPLAARSAEWVNKFRVKIPAPEWFEEGITPRKERRGEERMAVECNDLPQREVSGGKLFSESLAS